MLKPGHDRNTDRIKSAAAVAAFHALLGYALLTGLGFDVVEKAGSSLKLFAVPEVIPLPPVEDADAPEPRTPDPEGEAAPPNLEATPTPIVAPEPVIRLPVPPPVAAAPVAGPGSDPSAGAAPVVGPGTGAGGIGTGLGSGGAGSGTGGGDRIAVRARQVAGRIRNADYPRSASRAQATGTVDVRFTIGTDGRARGCTIYESSGHPDLDAATCRLIEQRFRFQPARDAAGRPVPELTGWEQTWWLEPR